jgi:hypothetical protein
MSEATEGLYIRHSQDRGECAISCCKSYVEALPAKLGNETARGVLILHLRVRSRQCTRSESDSRMEK